MASTRPAKARLAPPEMINVYIKCALWLSYDDKGNPLDERYPTPQAHKKMSGDCHAFYNKNWRDIEDGLGPEQAGHDFWLTRNGHGAGFWDGDWDVGDDTRGERLTKSAKSFGEAYVKAYRGEIHYQQGRWMRRQPATTRWADEIRDINHRVERGTATAADMTRSVVLDARMEYLASQRPKPLPRKGKRKTVGKATRHR